MLKSIKDTVFLKINFVVIIGFVGLMFCFDFLDKIEIFYSIDFPKFNRFLKVVVGLYSISFILFHISYVIGKLKYLIYTIIAVSLIFALKYNYWDLYFDEFYRYGFILIFYPVLHFSFQYSNRHEYLQLFYLVLKTFITINFLVIIIGFVFDILVFQTYQYGRFGYNGLILSQGLTPYIYLAATIIFWEKRDISMLVVVLLVSLISGVKGVYFSEFLLLILLVFYNKNLSKAHKIKLALIGTTIFIAALVVVFSTPAFTEVIRNDGYISAIFSYRIDNLLDTIDVNTADSFNILIGATGLQTQRLEMQLVDVLLFFGLIGVLFYTYFLVRVYRDIVKNTNTKVFFIAALSLSFLSGNLFYIPLSVVLFFLTLFCLNQEPIQKPKTQNSVT